MRGLDELKTNIQNNKIDKFYVFFGDEYAIRKHYIEHIGKLYDDVNYVDSWVELKKSLSTKSLFSTSQLSILYNDEDFLKQPAEVISDFIDRINGDDYCCIVAYDSNIGLDLEKSDLFKKFSEYITEFAIVGDKVAEQFVEAELSLDEKSSKNLAFNCNNLYGSIKLEADKIRSFAKEKGISEQLAYESLQLSNQMLERRQEFMVNDFMNAVLTANYSEVGKWYSICREGEGLSIFYKYLGSIYSDCVIAGLLKTYGIYDGSSRAYNYKLPWGRVKAIRELNLKLDAKDYFDTAFGVTEMEMLFRAGKLNIPDMFDYFIINVL